MLITQSDLYSSSDVYSSSSDSLFERMSMALSASSPVSPTCPSVCTNLSLRAASPFRCISATTTTEPKHSVTGKHGMHSVSADIGGHGMHSVRVTADTGKGMACKASSAPHDLHEHAIPPVGHVLVVQHHPRAVLTQLAHELEDLRGARAVQLVCGRPEE